MNYTTYKWPFLLLISFIISLPTAAQSTYQELISDSCECISEIGGSGSPTKRQKKATSCIEKSFKRHADVIDREMEDFLLENPERSEHQFDVHFQRKTGISLIEDCESFFDIVLSVAFQNETLGKFPKTYYIRNTASSMCECIDKYENLTQEQADKCMVPLFNIEGEAFKREYAKNPKLIEHTTYYLIMTCRKYAKLTLKQALPGIKSQ